MTPIFLRHLLLLALGLGTACSAVAQAWPSKPIRFIVPFAAGGANDLLARAAAEGASEHLGQPILIDNKPGAGGTLGSDLAAKSAPDGYTFLISAAGVISNSFIKKSIPFKDSDLTPVVMIGLAPSIIVVPANSKYNTLATTWIHRIAAFPELSTATEQGFGELQIAHWAGIHAPTGVAPEIMDKLAAAVDAGMKSPNIVGRLKPMGIEPIGGTRAAFNEFVNQERARLGSVAKAARMRED